MEISKKIWGIINFHDINELIQMYFVLQFIKDVNSMGEGDPKKLAKIEPSQILMIPKHWSLNFFS